MKIDRKNNSSPGTQKKRSGHFMRFLGYVAPYKKLVISGALGGIVKFSMPLLVPVTLKYMIDQVFTNPALTTDDKFACLFLVIPALAAGFLLVWAPFTFLRHYCVDKASHRAVFDLRRDLYYRILRMSSSFFSRNQSGGIVSRLMSDVAMAQNLVGSALTNIWIDGFAIFVAFYFLFTIDPVTALVSVIVFPAYILFFKKMRNRIKTHSLRIQQQYEKMSGSVQEKIGATAVIKAFTREREEGELFTDQSEDLFQTTMKSAGLQALNQGISGLFVHIAPLAVILLGGYRLISGDISVGSLVAIGMYLGPLYLPLQRFSELNVIYSNGVAALERIFEIMDGKPEIIDSHDAISPVVHGEVEFRDVDFSYNGTPVVLSGISFRTQPGMRVAVVGASGSGKSTLTNLIPRLYDVSSGSVLIDNVDVRRIKLDTLRGAIGMVLQDPVLFSGSIKENILYGNPEAGDKEVLEACRMANALDFIEQLPDGLETMVGERGVLLSGGQKQRITIARAFIKNPRILILDEATSALDSESELLIQQALQRLMEGRTSFIIAHRLSTVMRSDLILVLAAGRISEKGTHRELLDQEGIYSRNFMLQQTGQKSELLDEPPCNDA